MKAKERKYAVKLLEQEVRKSDYLLKKMRDIYKDVAHDKRNKELMIQNLKGGLI